MMFFDKLPKALVLPVALGFTLSFPYSALAAEVIEFVPGTPAIASEVNSNFRSLAESVEANTQALQALATFTGATGPRGPAGPPGPPGDGAGPALAEITVNVTCPESIQAAIDSAPAGNLTVNISGACAENVVVLRDRVFLQGVDTDGDQLGNSSISPIDPLKPALTVRGASNVVTDLLNFSEAIPTPDSVTPLVEISRGSYATIIRSLINSSSGSAIRVTQNASARLVAVFANVNDRGLIVNGRASVTISQASFESDVALDIDDGSTVIADTLTLIARSNSTALVKSAASVSGGSNFIQRRGFQLDAQGVISVNNSRIDLALLSLNSILSLNRSSGSLGSGTTFNNASITMDQSLLHMTNASGSLSRIALSNAGSLQISSSDLDVTESVRLFTGSKLFFAGLTTFSGTSISVLRGSMLFGPSSNSSVSGNVNCIGGLVFNQSSFTGSLEASCSGPVTAN